MQRQIQSEREGQGLRAGEAVDDDDSRLFDDLFDLLLNANHTPEVAGDALHCLLSSSCNSLGGVKRLELCKKMIVLQPQAIHVKCGGVRDCFPLQTYIEGLAHTPSLVCTSASVSMDKVDDKDDDLNARRALFNYLLTIHPDAVKAMDAVGLVPVFRAVGGFHTPPGNPPSSYSYIPSYTTIILIVSLTRPFSPFLFYSLFCRYCQNPSDKVSRRVTIA